MVYPAAAAAAESGPPAVVVAVAVGAAAVAIASAKTRGGRVAMGEGVGAGAAEGVRNCPKEREGEALSTRNSGTDEMSRKLALKGVKRGARSKG